jgi:hypothetical protein
MRTTAVFVFLLCACAAQAAPSSAPAVAEDVRVIRVCVLNDAAAPVDSDIMSSVLEAVSVDYAEHAGLAFAPDAVREYRGDLSAWQLDMGPALRQACPKTSEIRVLFTDRAPSRAETTPYAPSAGAEDAMAGDASPHFGFVILYRSSERWNEWNRKGERAIIGTFRHEAGHLFGLEHEKDAVSFMYSPSGRSDGAWTPSVTAAIRKERNRRWFPNR